MARLPAAFICGARVTRWDPTSVTVRVRTRWINKNPFGSMYFAVQAMAAELSTGALVMQAIRDCGVPISMLVTGLRAEYLKKATGHISFTCDDGDMINQQMAEVRKGVPLTFEMVSRGIDGAGDVVSIHTFTWSLKAKHPLNR